MLTHEQAAALLMRHAPGPEQVDALANTADITKTQLRVAPRTHARRFIRAGAAHAAELAACEQLDPAIAMTLAKSVSKSVKRALAANPAASEQALDVVARWALATEDEEALVALARTMDPLTWIPRVYDTAPGRNARLRKLLTEGVVAQLADRGDADLIRAVVAADFDGVNTALMSAALYGRLVLTAKEVFDGSDAALAMWFSHPSNLRDADADLVDVLLERAAAGPVTVPARSRQPVQVDTARIMALLTSDDSTLVELAVMSLDGHDVPGTLIRHIARTHARAIGQRLFTSAVVRAHLSPDDVIHVVREAADVISASVALKAMAFDDECTAQLLRHGWRHITADYLKGNMPLNPPRPGVVRLLAADPGEALTADTRTGRYHVPLKETSPLTVLLHVGELRRDACGRALVAAMDEILDEAGTLVLSTLTTNFERAYEYGALDVWVRGKLAALGSDPMAWATLAAMAPTWTGSLSDLVATARLTAE